MQYSTKELWILNTRAFKTGNTLAAMITGRELMRRTKGTELP